MGDGSPQSHSTDECRIKVHNADLYLDLLSAITYAPPSNETEDVHALHLGNRKDIQRENFEAKQRVREEEYKSQMESAKKETQRRVQENQKRKEAQFENMYGTLKSEATGFVQRVAKLIQTGEERDERRKEKHYEEWTEATFNPLSEKALNTTAQPQRSPTALDDEAVQYELPKLEPRNMNARQRDVLSATMWDKVEATPHGRYSEQNTRQHCVKRVVREGGNAAAAVSSAPLPNDYDVPVGERGKRIRQLESGRGKKITGPLKLAPAPPPRGALPLPKHRAHRGESYLAPPPGHRVAVST